MLMRSSSCPLVSAAVGSMPASAKRCRWFVTLIRINDMNCLVAAVEPIFYEGKQDPIFFLVAIEESADVTSFIEQGTSKRNWSSGPLHGVSPSWISSGP